VFLSRVYLQIAIIIHCKTQKNRKLQSLFDEFHSAVSHNGRIISGTVLD